MRWLVSYLLAVTPIAAEQDITLPQVFKLICDWEHIQRGDDTSPSPEFSGGIAFSSSSQPTLVKADMVEIIGVHGTRHFTMADIGGPLAGTDITVYADGQSVMVQNYRINGRIEVSAKLGTCEVLD